MHGSNPVDLSNNGFGDYSPSWSNIMAPPPPPNGAQFISQSVAQTMVAGQSYSVSVTMKNTGSNTWTTASHHNLGSQNAQDNTTWGMGRVALPSSVASGSQVTFNFTVTAPATSGTYNFQWRMVQDGVEWFGDLTPNVVVTVNPQSGGNPNPDPDPSTPMADVRWIVADQLGTPRMILDQSGSLANVSRHDYLPFGEELAGQIGGRTTQQGYTGDSTRQKFTQEERDGETGLDYFISRYYASVQGRFTSPDIFGSRKRNPQSWNRYSYVLNNPLRYTDPLGLAPQDPTKIRPEDVIKIVIHDKHPSLLKRIFGKIGGLFKGGSRTQAEGDEGEEGKSEEAREEENKADEKDLLERSPWRDPNGIPPVKIDESTIAPEPEKAMELEEASLTPRLNGNTPGEQLRDAVSRVTSMEGSPEAKAEMLTRFASQIRVRSEFQWKYATARGSDGSFMIFGPRSANPEITNAIVISPQGGMFRGSVARPGDFTFAGSGITPNYSVLKPIR